MYLPEKDILLFLLDWEYYTTYFKFIDLQHIKDNYKELYYVYLSVKQLHEDVPHKKFSVDDLIPVFFSKYPDLDKEVYLELFKSLSETKIDPDVGVGILKQIKRRKTAFMLSQAAYELSSNTDDPSKVFDLVKELEHDEEEEDGPQPENVDLEVLLNSAVKERGLRWRLDCLNKSLGSLRPGDFGFLFKRPESGGTAFCASEVAYMLDQTDKPILWIDFSPR